MRFLLLIFIFSCNLAWGQLVNSVELEEKLTATTEEAAKKQLLHKATMKSLEKFVPELGYKFDEFTQKLNSSFKEYFEVYKEKKLVEKFGAKHKESLTEAERKAFLETLEAEKPDAFIRFSRTLEILRSHSFSSINQDDDEWKAKISLDVDQIKLDKLLRRIIKGETKPFSKIILISVIDLHHFSWPDLGIESEKSFLKPLNDSWTKWLNEKLPSTVEEVVVCEAECMSYYKKWSETQMDKILVPEEYNNSVFLQVNIHLKRISVVENFQEMSFEWEGRTLLHDLATKKILGSYALPIEKRTFRQMDQKALNSGLASSIYRSPLTAFMQFNKKLEEKVGFNRVSKLVIKGFRHIGQVMELKELLKTRGSSLGLEVTMESFAKDEAKLLCFYQGEEKSFTDMLSALKDVKSTHGYRLVNEFTGVHHVIKFVTE